EVWPDSLLTDESNIVQVYVRSLRQKLGEAKALIQTVRGVGYVLKVPAALRTE
ncbi:MAG: helix-turn-helix domain-containing protein, partial [Cyanobacteria bacterium P01_H01_bin.162]